MDEHRARQGDMVDWCGHRCSVVDRADLAWSVGPAKNDAGVACRMLRITLELEALYNKIDVNPTVDVAKATEKFETLKKEYVEAAAQMPKDWIYRSRDEVNIEEALDKKLGVKRRSEWQLEHQLLRGDRLIPPPPG